jgi:hypothetical protein
MHRTIEKLMNNVEPVGNYFAAAKAKWNEILADVAVVPAAELAERLSHSQSWFERHCGGRWDGQEVMVLTGFASIYDVGIGYDREGRGKPEAVKLAEAFELSMCSLEVKGAAREVARSYYITRENGRYVAD